MAKLIYVRLLIALATLQSWGLRHIDVDNAFLNGHLEEEIYMLLPPGYDKAKPEQVCKLLRSLYGLKQASREWNHVFCAALQEFGFQQSVHDNCLFTKSTNTSFLALIVYVDDILITGTFEEEIVDLKAFLNTKFSIKDLCHARYFLGMEIARGSTGTFLNQQKYIPDTIAKARLSDCKPAFTPLPACIKFSHDQGDLFEDPERYRRTIGRLLYVNLTRPDICFAVQQLSQFVGNPRAAHWDATLHILKYLRGCPAIGLFYPNVGEVLIRCFCDADWGTCPDTRKSVTGYCIFLGNSLISLKTNKQNTVSTSSAETEYRAMSMTARELQWLTFLLSDLGMDCPRPISLWCDNQAALYIAKNPIFHERTKHIEIDCHIVRSLFKFGFLLPQKISSAHQLPDLFTKSLSRQPFLDLCSKLGLFEPSQPQLEGGCRIYKYILLTLFPLFY